MKRIIKYVLQRVLARDVLTIGNVLSKYNVVSFDVFDTLILRICDKPEDIFAMVQRKYNRDFSPMYIDNFVEIRKEAELKARKNKSKEITLEDIYNNMGQFFKSQIDDLKKIEIDVEMDFCVPNYEMLGVYKKLIDQGKKIFIISDMYLPKQVIEKILNKSGIEGYEELFVSSELGDTKHSGTLYDYIVSKYKMDKKKWIHIGDSVRADFYETQKRGISSFLYCRRKEDVYFAKRMNWIEKRKYLTNDILDYGVIRQSAINCAKLDSDIFEGVGRQVLGPLLLGYCRWLHEKVVSYKISKVFFLSREGFIIKKFYEILFPESKDRNVYLYISRLSISRASAINTTSFKELVGVFASVMRGINTVEDFIELVGLKNSTEKICELCNVSRNCLVNEIDKDSFYMAIMKVGEKYFHSQNQYFLNYLKNVGFCDEKVAIVDIGWSGTMQLKLQKIMPECDIYGFYFAVSNVRLRNSEGYELQKRFGYWCSEYEWDGKGQIIRFTQSAIETLFMNLDGTTLEYSQNQFGIVPILDKTQMDDRCCSVIKKAQKGAIGYAEYVREMVVRGYLSDINANICIFPFLNFAVYPSSHTLAFFKDLSFINGVSLNKLLPQHGMWYYIFHMREFALEFENNGCKTIWLRGLFKIRMPYYRLLIFLTKSLKLKTNFRKGMIE